MPSIFSRSRTQSAPYTDPLLLDTSTHHDEFGRLSVKSAKHSTFAKKDKSKAGEKKSRTHPGFADANSQEYDAHAAELDGGFLPLSLEQPHGGGVSVATAPGWQDLPKERDYGYLSYARHVILGLEQVDSLVQVVTEELNTRGLTTPFIFSSLALNGSSSAVKRLIKTFLNTCSDPCNKDAHLSWLEEAKFASPQELGMFLRWGLARIVRYVRGEDVRGLLSWDQYDTFCDSETALHYPPAHFETLLRELQPHVANILVKLFTVLTGLTAHSSSSGHTPPTLSPLFGPLIFGLGSATLPFHHAYLHYLRSANATEHLILAFIRWQDTPRTSIIASSASPPAVVPYVTTAALGVPTRLKHWIRGYPFAMLPFLEDPQHKTKPQPRKGARTVRVVSVRRNVRMYSPDLVRTCAGWAQRATFRANPGGVGGGSSVAGGSPRITNDLAASKVWERICPLGMALPPAYSDTYKKRMDMPSHIHPDIGPGSGLSSTSMSSAASPISTTTSLSSSSTSPLFGDNDAGNGISIGSSRLGEDRFTSLADLKWGEFEMMGFTGLESTEKKLQFDLTEGARTARAAKRTTLNWNDFSTTGFSRTDDPLSATLQFSTPLAHTISSWPTHSAELSKKLKQTQKALPPFGWDTEPVMGQEEVIEEAFVDVFCDLIYGGGWMDLERIEETDRECNWALVEFKALPPSQTTITTAPGTDPRTGTSVVLFEEFVPLEYRRELLTASTSRPRFTSLFHKSSKQWKPAPTLNGRPYVVGLVPQSPSLRELEFDTLLKSSTDTKVISLASSRRPISTQSHDIPRLSVMSALQPPLPPVSSEPAVSSKKSTTYETPSSPLSNMASKRASRFRLPGGIPVPSPGSARKPGLMPAEYSRVEFETRLASYSDDDDDRSGLGGGDGKKNKHKRRESRDDAWVDILVGTQDRRLAGQDADLKRPGVGAGAGLRGLRGGRSDPELASQEVAKALAAVKERTPSTDDDGGGDKPAEDDGSGVTGSRVSGLIGLASSRRLVGRGPATMTTVIASLVAEDNPVVPSATSGAVLDDLHAEGHARHGHRSQIGHRVGYDEDEDQDEDEEEHKDEEHGIERGLSPAAVMAARQKIRVGYFDLHPDRRPLASNTVAAVAPPPTTTTAGLTMTRPSFEEEDPRTILHADSDDEDGRATPLLPPFPGRGIPQREHEPIAARPNEPLQQQLSGSALSPTLRPPTQHQQRQPSPLPPPRKRDGYTNVVEEYDGSPKRVSQEPPIQIEIPEWKGDARRLSPSPVDRKTTAHGVPAADDVARQQQQLQPQPHTSQAMAMVSGSKRTAALIDLYRQREQSVVVTPASRIPVRVPLGIIEAEDVEVGEEDEEEADGRYRHGTLLHGVMEEDEEE